MNRTTKWLKLPLLILIIGIVFTLYVFYEVRKTEQKLLESEFTQQASSLASILQQGIDRNVQILESFAALYTSIDPISRNEFHHFVTELLSNHGDIQALEWIPRVSSSQRDAYEHSATQIFPNFRFTEKQASGRIVSAANRAEYFPVYFVEPLQGNEAAFGYDLASNPSRLAALESSRDSGEMKATVPVVLIQGDGFQRGFLMIYPVYGIGEVPTSPATRRTALRGYVLGVFRIDNMIDYALRNIPTAEMAITVRDSSVKSTEGILYSRPHRTEGGNAEQVLHEGFHYVQSLSVPGQNWLVHVESTSAFETVHKVRQAWWALACGLIFTIFVASYVQTLKMRARKHLEHIANLAESAHNLKQEITERKDAEEKIWNLAYFDVLTKLPNRRLAMDRLDQALITSNGSMKYGVLLMLDLDDFKSVNDTRGHDVGDQLLVEVGRRIVSSLRLEDTVSRFGGDEYMVIIEGLETDKTLAVSLVETIADKIKIALNQPYTLNHVEYTRNLTTSIGAVLFRDNADTIDVLLKHADTALYEAKVAGRNTITFFNPAMQAALESRLKMENALSNGLQNGEFQLFYQPQVDQQGCLIGAEALLRWFTPEKKIVSPVHFIQLAEDTGLILPLGLWVMQTACTQLKTWSENPSTSNLHISINVSARQFHQPNFVEQVFDTLKCSGANPTLLRLELTESIVLEKINDVINRMRQIRALGVTFSLDDFGTGFSSLSYLKRLPLNEVKIDQSFVRDITSDPSDAAIVCAIIAMNKSLGIQVIAEGVETEEQLYFLLENGCTNFQGYLFGKPVAIDEWSDLYKGTVNGPSNSFSRYFKKISQSGTEDNDY
ncbi:EAL domain-containing protein [Glaciimonas sp. CA11.2]|uniref:bifunctional diguanylate cyclase/phosphodiesterase n=1 Tax=Glaciimonas sp. CA11.2 TaxID=3048601 RepID=UPI002AB33FF2|nr:EAL domain-containing protein [Glaciimonas sp. CA11.2]MDY7548204.1 EAL domain-containing protein [Glaciimonas sp. CA11.2]